MQSLLTALRKAAPSTVWSAGSELARTGTVWLERSSEEEIVLRVRAPGWEVPPTAVLYPEDQEWTCDCAGSDPCPHVVAAALAVHQARQRGEALPSLHNVQTRLGYRLQVNEQTLTVVRCLVHSDGREEPLRDPLTSLLADPTRSSTVLATEADLKIERTLERWQHQPSAFECITTLLGILSDCQDVKFEGQPVRTSNEVILPRAVIDDYEGGFSLRIECDPSVTAVVARGVVRCDSTLHPLGARDLTGDLLEKLPIVRTFATRDVAELVLDILPALSERIPVTVRTQRLPSKDPVARPRIHMEFNTRQHTLSVLPMIVYGDPPQARIEGHRMVYLSGAVPVRDLAAERELVTRLRDELNMVPGRFVHFDGQEAVRFATRLRAWAARHGDQTDPTLAFVHPRPVVPRFEIHDDRFELLFEIPDTDETHTAPSPRPSVDAQTVLRAWQDGLDLVPLIGGGWAPLPSDWLEKHGHQVADLLAARDEHGRIVPAALPSLARLCDELEHPRPPTLERLAPLLDDFQGIPHAPLPADLTATLRNYQRQGVDWLCFLRQAGLGAVLADDMGLGKTLQTLCAIDGRTLVISPRSVVYNWLEEIRRFRPALRVSLYHGPKRQLDPEADVVLTTYAILRTDIEVLSRQDWDTVVLDEAQAIKNPDSQVARAAYQLRGRFRLALSGTPVENRLDELWSIFHFTHPGLLGGRTDFLDRYARAIAEGNPEAARRLRNKIRPFVLRRRKQEVLPELPPRTDVVLYCELDEYERAVYNTVLLATRKEVLSQLHSGGSVLAALEALLRLRQAACHPDLVPGQKAFTSSKVSRLIEALEEAVADGHKALVFSQWTSLLDRVEPALHQAGISFVRLDGSTSDRASVVNEFQSPQGPPVLLISLKAGGTGLNLTAADHVFLLDPWWNPAVEDQAADRAHRIGQDKPVMVYHLVARDTVEERILELQHRKRSLVDTALAGTGHTYGISREELLALLD